MSPAARRRKTKLHNYLEGNRSSRAASGTLAALTPGVTSATAPKQVRQELSSATGDVRFGAPVISSRDAETRLLVADRRMIVIGGLRDEVREEGDSGR